MEEHKMLTHLATTSPITDRATSELNAQNVKFELRKKLNDGETHLARQMFKEFGEKPTE